MSRRSTPERIDAARRAAVLSRLTGHGMSVERAQDWIARWEAQAARDGVERGSGFWDAGVSWIEARSR
jgi:hypothetical protein